MTRDEAVVLVHKCNGGIGAECFVDALSNLGILKLDDPKEKDHLAAIDRLRNIFVRVSDDRGFGPFTGRLSADGASEVIDVLTKSGFKITR